ncbi:MAG: HPr(Ser) kinase/phosphatase [Bacteroidetes bacterium]|nr:HPr(Ser) kinase/phosphatase [Bacteroidota bacterium]
MKNYLSSLKISRKSDVTVNFLYQNLKNRLKLKKLNNAGGENKITDKNLHRPGLAIAGYVDLFTYQRVQIVGNTEIRYLKTLTLEKQIETFKKLFSFNLPCLIITNQNKFHKNIIKIAQENNIALFSTPIETTKTTYFVSDFLDDHFSPQTTIHGSFIDVYGVGVLIIGPSGIGKSEVALDLVERGHRLVADDVIKVHQKGEGILIGTGTELVKHFMEIRGLGLVDIRRIFGIRSIRFQKRVEVIVELQEWDRRKSFTRTGLDLNTAKIIEVDIPHIQLQIFPGKNITVIIEVIALNYLQTHYGYNAAKAFANRLEKVIKNKNKQNKRAINYFEHDFE